MASSKWKKRGMKLKGFANMVYSGLLLRYTSLNAGILSQQIQKLAIDKLHVGCGNVLLKGWLNVRYERREEYGRVIPADNGWLLNYNLLKPWPIEANSIRFVAGSHFIEHLDLNQGIEFLKETLRVLRKGGVVRLSCPDMELYAKNYVARNQNFFQHKLIREWCAFKQAETPGEIFIAKAYDSGGSHKWFYDFESLRHILETAGFKDVRRCERLEGRVPDLPLLEPPGRELETVYVEAVKENL